MSTSPEESLTVGKLLTYTYEELTREKTKIIFGEDKKGYAVIGDDSDDHRTRTGYMCYDEVCLIDSNGIWAIGNGKSWGRYPAKPYDSDLLALPLETKEKTTAQLQEELRESIPKSTYFANSLFYGKDDGTLRTGPNENLIVHIKTPFEKKIKELVMPRVQEFITQETAQGSILFQPEKSVTYKMLLYDTRFIGFLTDATKTVLSETSWEDTLNFSKLD